MNRIFLGGLLALALGGSAMAQASGTTSNTTTGNKVGLAKPPAGTAPPSHKKSTSGNTNNLNNTPLTPQIAVQPSMTIGSPVPINGPGGTTMNPTSSSQ